MAMDEACLVDGNSCIILLGTHAPVPRTRPSRSRSRSMRSQERDLKRRISLLSARFDVVMSSLVRAEQASLSAERVALAAALTFREEAKILGDTIAAITPVLR